MSLLVEDLRNRRVVRVAVRYVLVAVALVLGLGMIQPAVGLPEWTVRMVAAVSFFAMPFLLVLIWALENRGPEASRVKQRRVVGAPGPTSRTDRTP
jgi:hypothetical protein